MKSLPSNRSRSGAALVALLAALAIASVLLAGVTWQSLAQRRVLRHRQDQLQTQWLARAGFELAAERLLADPEKYRGETLDPIPGGKIIIQVERPKDAADLFLVQVESSFSENGKVVRGETRRFRRVTQGAEVRLEVVPEPDRSWTEERK